MLDIYILLYFLPAYVSDAEARAFSNSSNAIEALPQEDWYPPPPCLPNARLSNCTTVKGTGSLPVVEHHRDLRLTFSPRDPLDVQPDPSLPLRAEATALLHDQSPNVFDRPFAFRTDGRRDDLREQRQAALDNVSRRLGTRSGVPVVILLRASQNDLYQYLPLSHLNPHKKCADQGLHLRSAVG